MKGQRVHFNKQKDGTTLKTRSGKKFTLLTPEEKARKYAVELRSGRNIYTGEHLSDSQLAHRSGYLSCRSDEAKLYNFIKEKKRKGR